MRSETHDKAFAMGKKALELDPGNLRYATNLGHVLINLEKTAEAKLLTDRIRAAARDPHEIQMGDSLRQAGHARAAVVQYIKVRPPNSGGSAPSCTDWKAQRAEIVFQGNPAGEFDGELVAIHFR